MQINSNFNVGGSDPVAAKRTTKTSVAAATDDVSFPGASALDQALASVPNSRPEAVARAKQLIADPNYPSGETLKQLAGFLARKLTAGTGTLE